MSDIASAVFKLYDAGVNALDKYNNPYDPVKVANADNDFQSFFDTMTADTMSQNKDNAEAWIPAIQAKTSQYLAEQKSLLSEKEYAQSSLMAKQYMTNWNQRAYPTIRTTVDAQTRQKQTKPVDDYLQRAATFTNSADYEESLGNTDAANLQRQLAQNNIDSANALYDSFGDQGTPGGWSQELIDIGKGSVDNRVGVNRFQQDVKNDPLMAQAKLKAGDYGVNADTQKALDGIASGAIDKAKLSNNQSTQAFRSHTRDDATTIIESLDQFQNKIDIGEKYNVQELQDQQDKLQSLITANTNQINQVTSVQGLIDDKFVDQLVSDGEFYKNNLLMSQQRTSDAKPEKLTPENEAAAWDFKARLLALQGSKDGGDQPGINKAWRDFNAENVKNGMSIEQQNAMKDFVFSQYSDTFKNAGRAGVNDAQTIISNAKTMMAVEMNAKFNAGKDPIIGAKISAALDTVDPESMARTLQSSAGGVTPESATAAVNAAFLGAFTPNAGPPVDPKKTFLFWTSPYEGGTGWQLEAAKSDVKTIPSSMMDAYSQAQSVRAINDKYLPQTTKARSEGAQVAMASILQQIAVDPWYANASPSTDAKGVLTFTKGKDTRKATIVLRKDQTPVFVLYNSTGTGIAGEIPVNTALMGTTRLQGPTANLTKTGGAYVLNPDGTRKLDKNGNPIVP